MPTNRAGDKTATQAPSAKPEPEGTITQALPADGDPDNASTFAQAFKVVADFIDFLLKPQAKLSAWAQWIMAFRSAGGHKRFLIDHFGLPAGRIVQWREDWSTGKILSGTKGPVDLTGTPIFSTDPLFVTKFNSVGQALINAGAAVDFATAKSFLDAAGVSIQGLCVDMGILSGASPWQVRTVTAGAGSSFVIPVTPDAGTIQGKHRYVQMGTGNTINDYALLYRVAPCNYDQDLHVPIEWEAQLEATGMGATITACMGLCTENALPASVGGAAADYVVFEKSPSGNWFIRYRSAAGTPQGIDTGVAATTSWTRFRIELHGANVAESAGRALRCYINGTQVGGDITTNVPATTAKAAPHFSCTATSGGASGLSFPLRLGPVRMTHNLYGSDVA